jgi:hypothetical protein
MAKMNPLERLTGPGVADPIQSVDFPGAELNQKTCLSVSSLGGE